MHNRCTHLLAAVVAVLLLTTCAMADSVTIEEGGNGRYKTVRLVPAVYNAANADLGDLRLLDSTGEAVPYFLHSRQDTIQQAVVELPLVVLDSYQKDDAFYFDFALATPPQGDVQANALSVATTANSFAKEVELLGSHDGLHWEKVLNGTLYSVEGNSKLTLDFPEVQKYTSYRLRLANNLEKIALSGATLTYSTLQEQHGYFTEQLAPRYTITTRERETVVMLEGVRNLRVAAVTLHTTSMFQRTVSALGQSKTLYNLTFDNRSLSDTTLELGRQRQQQDTLELVIRDNDDRPVEISSVELVYYADELVFEGGKGPYTLVFGEDAQAVAPVYDIASYKNQVLDTEPDRLVLGEITPAPAPMPEPVQPDYMLLFNILVLAVTALLAVLLIAKLRVGKKNPPAQ